jgi:hypothetical protein
MTANMVADQAILDDCPQCPNCSAELNGTYCSECGQRQTDLDRPFRDMTVFSFLALRSVCGQGGFVTALKMVALLFGYLVALIVTMVLTLALTVITV